MNDWIDVDERLPEQKSETDYDCITLVDGKEYPNTFVFRLNEWVGFNKLATHWKPI